MSVSLTSTITFAAVLSLAALSPGVLASPDADPCAKFAGQTYVVSADARACLSSFPFNETLRQNVLTVVSRVFDFYTFEDYYLDSPPPFQESTVNIRQELARINSTSYDSDYAFNRDLFDFVNSLNDGHTAWYPSCYQTFQNILPAPVVTLEVNGNQSVYVAPDSVAFISLFGTNYTSYFDSLNFDWARLAGARVLQIEGMDAYAYADLIADTYSGNYLDHGVRVNSVFSSYRIVNNTYSQRVGDIAGPGFPDRDNLTMTLIPVNATEQETVIIPFLASYGGEPFTDSASYWQANCAANNETNGVDYLGMTSAGKISMSARKQPRALIYDRSANTGVGLPSQSLPNLTVVDGGEGVIKSYILPDNKTGVMFVGSFEPDNYISFQDDTAAAITQFHSANITRLIVDLTNNGGGYVCLGEFLHQYLAGTSFGFPGYQTAIRANTLAQRILASDIALGVTSNISFYAPDNWAYINDTALLDTVNYFQPIVNRTINGVVYSESQRILDICTPFNVEMPAYPPFDLQNVAIVSNGDCASTCAQFSTLMYERHNTKIAVFGGKPNETMQYKGMAGEQVLEWYDIDTEIKTAGLKDDPLAPPDLLVNANFRYASYSYFSQIKQLIRCCVATSVTTGEQVRYLY
ncbi:hypothetical protein AcV5_009489 [Taiwanofungus camphoratus]|nr:hypothetical protein AcV5_009489 [Antrodia cinnamomea]